MKIEFADEVYEVEQIYQYEDIEYHASLSCDCGKADYTNTYSYEIIGYADTPHGYMIVVQCPKCFDKYRHHIGGRAVFNFDKFKEGLGLILHIQHHNNQ